MKRLQSKQSAAQNLTCWSASNFSSGDLPIGVPDPEGGAQSPQPGICLQVDDKGETRSHKKRGKRRPGVPSPGIPSRSLLPSSRDPAKQTSVRTEAGLQTTSWGAAYLAEEVVQDLVVGEDWMRSHPEQKVLQADPTALHEVWVHVVG